MSSETLRQSTEETFTQLSLPRRCSEYYKL